VYGYRLGTLEGKGKVVSMLFLTEHHTMKMFWWSGGITSRIIDLGTRSRSVVRFTPRPLYPQGKNPRTHWLGGWVGSRAALDVAVKGKIPSPYRDSNPLSSSL